MKTIVEPVVAFNGRILYGCDNDRNNHDSKWLFLKKSGAYAQTGQVAVIMENSGEIIDTKLCKNRTEAYKYIFNNVKSEGIMA